MKIKRVQIASLCCLSVVAWENPEVKADSRTEKGGQITLELPEQKDQPALLLQFEYEDADEAPNAPSCTESLIAPTAAIKGGKGKKRRARLPQEAPAESV